MAPAQASRRGGGGIAGRNGIQVPSETASDVSRADVRELHAWGIRPDTFDPNDIEAEHPSRFCLHRLTPQTAAPPSCAGRSPVKPSQPWPSPPARDLDGQSEESPFRVNYSNERESANGMVRPRSYPLPAVGWQEAPMRTEHAMAERHNSVIAVMYRGKNAVSRRRPRRAWRDRAAADVVAWPGGPSAITPGTLGKALETRRIGSRKERRAPPDWPGALLRPACLDRRRLQRSRVLEKFIWLPLP